MEKIVELTGIKDIVKKNYDVKIPGAEKLGVGNGGQVFGIKNKPYVIKITRFDLGYLNWVKFCQNYSGEYKRFLPRFGKVLNVKDMFDERLNIIQMEKLKPYTGKKFIIRFAQKQAVKTILKYSKEYPSIKINNIDDFYNMLKDYDNFFNDVDNFIEQKLFNESLDLKDLAKAIKSILPIVTLYENLSDNNKLLVKFILSEFIFKDIPNEGINFIGEGTKLDIHHENLMMRENGEIILTDPWFNISSNLIDIGVIAKIIRQGKKQTFENQQINELTGIKKVFDNPMDYVESLGFKHIRSGDYGSTFMGSKNVLKIFSDDSAYEKYISLYKHLPNQFRKFMPKNNGVKVWPADPKYKVIKLEKLDPLTSEITTKFQHSGFKMYFEHNTPEIIKTINQSNNFQDFIEKIKLTDSYYDSLWIVYDFIGFEMLQFIAWLYQHIDFFKFDLHSGNFMLRDDQLVLIDPWYESLQ